MESKTYATFGLMRSVRQVKQAVTDRSKADSNMLTLLSGVRSDERRIATLLNKKEVQDCKILEIGPGQGMERAHYYGRHNTVDALDLDIIPRGFHAGEYYRMLRENGFGRFAKTIGRKLIVGGANRDAWADAINAKTLNDPNFMHGDIAQEVPATNAYDVVMSWSVWEHIPDPRAALENVIAALKPGGAFYISLHLYTCNNGHHDIRAFTGDVDALPLWAHLRPSTVDGINPSSYLNEWRIAQWRELLNELCPGHTEWAEKYEHPEVYGPKLVGPLREELADYTDEELLTVNLIYGWRKPLEA